MTVHWLNAERPELEFIAPMASPATREIFAAALARFVPHVKVRLLDVALVASGTASLECALCKRPMVVVYRLGVLSAWVLRRLNLVKARFFAQPNLLADRRVVGEYFQEQIVPGSIGAELLAWLDDAPRRAALEEEFTAIHRQLRQGGSAAAAAAILTLAGAARA